MLVTICSRRRLGLRIATLGSFLVGISVSLGTGVRADNFRIDYQYLQIAAPSNTPNNAAPSRRARQRLSQPRSRPASMAYQPSSMASEKAPIRRRDRPNPR
jgi:hypothetical protein